MLQIQEMPGEPLSPSDFENAGKLTIGIDFLFFTFAYRK